MSIGFKPVILWTDFFVALLLGMLVWFFRILHRDPELWQRFTKVFMQPLRLVASLVLLFYIIIGLLDCLHYRPAVPATVANQAAYSNKIKSVLDAMLAPLDSHKETSYSQPFATKSFTKEMRKDAAGYIYWHSEELAYVSHASRFKLLTYGLLTATIINLLMLSAFFFGYEYKYQRNPFNDPTVPWKSFWATIATFIYLLCIVKYFLGEYHIFGTDKVGTDVFYAAVKSIRTGLVIGTLTTLVTLPFAILLGTAAGYFRGIVDDIIQYIYTTLNSIPGVLLIAASVLTMQVIINQHGEWFTSMDQRADLRLLVLCIILGLTSWTNLCRLLRAETLKLRELDYILAARALGVTDLKILYKHIVPNLLHIILIAIVFDFSGLVLAEAVLSYVGVGVDPSTFSWGNMINGARLEMAREPVIWWSLLASFTMMFFLVLAANIFSDGVRDAFDPRTYD